MKKKPNQPYHGPIRFYSRQRLHVRCNESESALAYTVLYYYIPVDNSRVQPPASVAVKDRGRHAAFTEKFELVGRV